ncbi:type VI secretion protein [Streptomyces sp. ZYX-F-203]
MRPDEGRREGRGGVPDGLLVGGIGFLLGMTLLTWTATGLAGLLAHGSWPSGVAFTRTPSAMRLLVADPRDIPGAWPGAAPVGLPGHGLFWGVFLGQLMVLVVLSVFVLGTLARWKAVRRHRTATRGGAGAEAGPQPADHRHGPAGESPAEDSAPRSTRRPAGARTPVPAPPAPPGAGGDPGGGALPLPAASPGRAIRKEDSPTGPAESTTEARAKSPSHEAAPRESVVPSGPPEHREGPLRYGPAEVRGPLAVRAVRDAAGPVLVVTSNPGVWRDTKDARAKLGPVHLYDPAHLCDTPSRLRWAPTAGCQDPATAAERAAALLAPVRPTARLDQAVSDTARTLLRCYLHAAALEGRTVRHLHRWAQGNQVQDAVRTLRTHTRAAPGSAGELEAALTAYPERRDMAHELTSRTLAALSAVNVRQACTSHRADALALDSFVEEGGSLYVVGESLEDPRSAPGAMPLLTALASSVVERGRRVAARSSSGRLDPPLTLVLEDVAAVAPLPRLPELLASGGDRGLPTLALLRSPEQGRARWPREELPA